MTPLRKIAEAEIPCLHPEHDPPTTVVLKPGTYEYECPACGRTVQFDVPMVVY